MISLFPEPLSHSWGSGPCTPGRGQCHLSQVSLHEKLGQRSSPRLPEQCTQSSVSGTANSQALPCSNHRHLQLTQHRVRLRQAKTPTLSLCPWTSCCAALSKAVRLFLFYDLNLILHSSSLFVNLSPSLQPVRRKSAFFCRRLALFYNNY